MSNENKPHQKRQSYSAVAASALGGGKAAVPMATSTGLTLELKTKAGVSKTIVLKSSRETLIEEDADDMVIDPASAPKSLTNVAHGAGQGKEVDTLPPPLNTQSRSRESSKSNYRRRHGSSYRKSKGKIVKMNSVSTLDLEEEHASLDHHASSSTTSNSANSFQLSSSDLYNENEFNQLQGAPPIMPIYLQSDMNLSPLKLPSASVPAFAANIGNVDQVQDAQPVTAVAHKFKLVKRKNPDPKRPPRERTSDFTESLFMESISIDESTLDWPLAVESERDIIARRRRSF